MGWLREFLLRLRSGPWEQALRIGDVLLDLTNLVREHRVKVDASPLFIVCGASLTCALASCPNTKGGTQLHDHRHRHHHSRRTWCFLVDGNHHYGHTFEIYTDAPDHFPQDHTSNLPAMLALSFV